VLSIDLNKKERYSMTHTESSLHFNLQTVTPTFCYATITIPGALVNKVYLQSIAAQSVPLQAYGIQQQHIGLEFVENNMQTNLMEHIKEFLLKYFVISFLYKELFARKVPFAGEPRLNGVTINGEHDAVFKFELTVFPTIQLQEWRYLPFKAPRRKNYKDLDRQVESFIQEEATAQEKTSALTVGIGDLVNFDVTLIDKQHNKVVEPYKENVWLRIGDEEADEATQKVFFDKKIGDTFTTTSSCLQEYFSNQIDTAYNFLIEIKDVLKNSYFCLEHFKTHFKLKTKKDLYQKLIEVFSYRNDLSQRRAMVEESLKLLLSKHAFEVPNHLVLRQQKLVLDAVQDNPDYYVYRMQRDFNDRIRELAYKQIKELIFIDQLAQKEDMLISDADIKAYLNLTKRARTKEFIYFGIPMAKQKTQEAPISTELIRHACLREKTLNHVIYHLTKI
jgi:FKBP-type peptidyl-prolyl cis-trans isomerase (trigger factor)